MIIDFSVLVKTRRRVLMSNMKISVCGKGGSGKSVLTAMLAFQAQARGLKVLVIDSDESNSGLYRLLGFQKPPTPLLALVGGKNEVRQRMGRVDLFAGEQILVDDIPAPYIVERDNLKSVSIGKIMQSLEGCACPMGVLCREFLNKLRLTKGEVAIVDMEAGVEHFGRGIDEHIDTILLVVEPSMESVFMAEKIRELAVGVKKTIWAVLNKTHTETMAAELVQMLEKNSIDVVGVIPYDPAVFEACLKGHTIARTEGFQAAGQILSSVLERTDNPRV